MSSSTQDVRSWSVKDVCRWIGTVVKLPQYQQAFQENEVNGNVLLELKGEDLREMGITKVGHRKHMELAVGALRAQLFYATLQNSYSSLSQQLSQPTMSQQQQQFSQPKLLYMGDGDEPVEAASHEPVEVATAYMGDGDEPVEIASHELVDKQQQFSARQLEKRKRGPDSTVETEEHSPKRQKQTTTAVRDVVCPICMEQESSGTLVTLFCGDQFCKSCLKTFCETQAKSKQFPVLCPNPKCKRELNAGDLAHVLNKQQLEQFEQAAIEALADRGDFCYCPTPNCGYIFLYDKNDDPHFRCEKCKQHYCLACKCPWHGGASCVQYRKWKQGNNNDDELFLRFAQRANLKRCPTCNRFVEKRGGCGTIYCLCGTNFCYACGKTTCECVALVHLPQLNPVGNQLNPFGNQQAEADDDDEGDEE